MKIYTKQGDKGKTSVYTHTVLKLDKDDLLLECYGTLDELNAQLGLAESQLQSADNALKTYCPILEECQQQLFSIGFAISDNDKLSEQSIQALEQHIDEMQQQMRPQTSFILPGGSRLSAQLHVARTIARRAERRLVSVAKAHEINDIALAYINRLSDFLFVLARFCNYVNKIEDIKV